MTAAASARMILTRLHEVMASRLHAQAKLDRVVDIVGDSLDSEVCSIYLLREGMLELFATRGLNKGAVHVTRMAIGEGLTGTIAHNNETLNLAEAKAHPDFLIDLRQAKKNSTPLPAFRLSIESVWWAC